MRDETIARNYAAALYELAARHGDPEDWGAAFRSLTEALESDPQVERFLVTPKIDVAAKQRALRGALEGRVPERFLRFVMVVLAKRRQRLLPAIRLAYEAILDEHAGRVHAEVVLAREPDEATREAITERLSAILGKQVVAHVTVNPSILGGLVVRYGDRRIDGSLRRRLVSLKREMMHAHLPETPAVSA